jgi:predicted nucleotide-binding protein (sugar kinase/HSP70/actin superfamily)
MKIGIPRSMTYFWFYPFWKAYFDYLKIETIVSPPTNKEILNAGLKLAVDEACLPIKIFLGHVDYLINKADFIFIPSIKSTEPKRYYCPQVIALPETTMMAFDKKTFLTPEINSHSKDLKWKDDYRDFALKLGYDHATAKEAVEKACVSFNETQNIDDNQYYETNADTLKIALVGHPYLVNDPFVNFDIKSKLIQHGAVIKTPQELSPKQVDNNTTLLKKDLFWSYQRNMVAAPNHYSKDDVVDGFIFLSTFGCGTNAIIEPYILTGAKKLPFVTITLDEHTSPTGIQTRLEAFLDMVARYKEVQNESSISLDGALAYRS